MMFNTFQEATAYWQDSPDIHRTIYNTFTQRVEDDPALRAHRNFIEAHDYGFGERSFHWMWNLICQDMPRGFRFLEVGVFKGQVVSLVSLLNERFQKDGQIYGLTPLSSLGDNFSRYAETDYRACIMRLYQEFGLDPAGIRFIEGLSTDSDVVARAQLLAPFDCVYIDGGHDYPTVVNDIRAFGPLVAPNGLLVMDDSANYLNIPEGVIRMNWRGIIDVSNAVRDHLETDATFEHIFSCAHNRIWRKIG